MAWRAWFLALAACGSVAACAVPAVDGSDCVCNCDDGCGADETFTFLANGNLSQQNTSMNEVEVGDYREIVVYVEQASANCANGNGNTWVLLQFTGDGNSPVGGTGQGFNFTTGGGRFRVDGEAVKMHAQCSGEYSFDFTISGVVCVGEQG